MFDRKINVHVNFMRDICEDLMRQIASLLIFCSVEPSKNKTFQLCLQNILPNNCEILLKMFINIKTFGLKIISIMFPMIFVSLFL